MYAGRDYKEFDPGSSAQDRLKWAWSTLDERPSFWPTRAALLEILGSAGFTSLHETLAPAWTAMPEDRITLLAFKGVPPAAPR